MNSNGLVGFLLVNKPTGVTSYYCINKLKNALGFRTKIGHAGTLDSFATGLLIIAIGRPATRHLGKIMELDKWYTATGKLGQLTDTLDFTGQLLEDVEIPAFTEDQIKAAIHQLGNHYRQIPPVYSALKYKGRSLSDLAREEKLTEEQLQKIVEEKAKVVTIYSCELISVDLPFFTVETHVSHGTYIRVLLNDIASKLATFATTHELHRTKIGPFCVEKAIPLNDFKTVDDIEQALIPIDSMLDILNQYTLP